MASPIDFIVPLGHAVGKCQIQVPYSCAIGMYRRHHTDDPDLWCRANDPAYLEAEGSDLQCRKCAVQRSARRELGALLRSRRLELGLTVEQVAERLLCSPSKVSRMETGQRGATQRDVRDLCDLYAIASAGERKDLVPRGRR